MACGAGPSTDIRLAVDAETLLVYLSPFHENVCSVAHLCLTLVLIVPHLALEFCLAQTKCIRISGHARLLMRMAGVAACQPHP